MEACKVIAITHRKAGLETVGKFHIEDETATTLLPQIKEELGWDELLYLSTCNRVEFYISSENGQPPESLARFFGLDAAELKSLSDIYYGERAIEHLFRVASSLDSMIIGEREIITQVRNAFEKSKSFGISGDNIRLAIRKTIEHAKRVYTETGIANKPVSVVSLAFRELKNMQLPKDSRIVVVGAGQTNRAMTRFLPKAGFNNITVYNRTFENARELANEIGATAKPLSELPNHQSGMDILITCTASEAPIITPEIYQTLVNGAQDKKVIIDLAVPEDTSPEVLESNKVDFLSVATLKPIAEQNLKERSGEIKKCEDILSESMQEFSMMYDERLVERAMTDVPKQVKDLREHAVDNVFANELDTLDPKSREVLDKVINYMEKKYISGPMKMAKEIILDKKHAK